MDDNNDFINCWNEILVPKWNRFRHILSGNGGVHSDMAFADFDINDVAQTLNNSCKHGSSFPDS